jgi:hypothetical protein
MTNRCRFTIIKYAHDPLRHEPVNVGVALWKVEDPTTLVWRFDDSFRRVERLYPSASTRAVKVALAAFREVATLNFDTLVNGYGGSGSVLITEPRATRCEDLDVEVADLFETYVEPAETDSDEPREKHRSSRFVKGRMNEFFKRLGVLKRLQNDQEAQRLRLVHCKSGVKHAFDYAYRNGVVHRIDAISFDYGTSIEKIARARSFANLADDVLKSSDGQDTVIEAVIQAPTEPLEPDVYDQAKKILDTVPLCQNEVFTDEDLEKYCTQTSAQLHSPP